ncbi:MAG: sugar-binding domain-containing protein, partial [Oscillospiraceae bacterium]
SYWRQLDAAVFGLGGPPDSEHFLISELDAESVGKLVGTGAVGDILSQYFLPDGSPLPSEKTYSTTALDIRKLTGIKKTICIAGGSKKVRAIMAAAGKKYFRTLLTDMGTAKEIYSILREEGRLN